MRRLSLLVAAVVVGGLTFTAMATASRPYMETDTVDAFSFSSCGFPVLFQPAAQDFTHLFVFSNGEQFASGPFLGTLTNLDTGTSIQINISGTVTYRPNSDGSFSFTFDGPTLLINPHVIVDGRVVVQFDADGNPISRTIVGTQEDVCTELAAP
jgi:hypothetical protein